MEKQSKRKKKKGKREKVSETDYAGETAESVYAESLDAKEELKTGNPILEGMEEGSALQSTGTLSDLMNDENAWKKENPSSQNVMDGLMQQP